MNTLRGNQGPRYRHDAGESAPYETITVAKLTPIIGAEIGGVDLSQPLGNRQFDEIHRALAENLVIFFRDQDLTPEQHLGFGRRFGELHIHPAAPHEPGQIEVATKSTVHHHGVARPQPVEEAPPQPAIVELAPAMGGGQPGATSQVKESQQLHQRLATTRLLPLGLWIAGLQGGSVWQRHRCTVHHQQAPRGALSLAEPGDHMRKQRHQPTHRQTEPRLAVGACVLRGRRLLVLCEERLHPCHCLAAGTTRIKHLSEKGPEGHFGSKHPIPAPGSQPGLVPQQIHRHVPAKKRLQLRRAQPIHLSDLLQRFERPGQRRLAAHYLLKTS